MAPNSDASIMSSEERILSGFKLSMWSDGVLEFLGVGITLVDLKGRPVYWNRWARDHLDRKPEYIGDSIHNRHHRAITNPRFDAMLKLFVDGRMEPVTYVARPYGKMTILVTVSPIHVDGELVGYTQIVQKRDEIAAMFDRFSKSGNESFERDMLPKQEEAVNK